MIWRRPFLPCAGLLLVVAGCGGGASIAPDARGPDATPADAATTDGTTGAVARFVLPQGGPPDLGALPFPGDLYQDVAGAITIGRLPVGPAATSFVDTLRRDLGTLDGFGVTTSLFFEVEGPIAQSSLSGSAHLYDLEGGQEIPVRMGYHDLRGWVVLVPAAGSVLLERHRYGAILMDSLLGAGGGAVEPSAEFVMLREASSAPSDPTQARAYAMVHDALAVAQQQGIAPAHVIAATSFRTQSITRVTEKLRAAAEANAPVSATVTKVIAAGDPEMERTLGTPTGTEAGIDNPGGIVHDQIGYVVHGSLPLKSYTSSTSGQPGLMTLDTSGAPEVKATFPLKFVLALPKNLSSYANLPLVVFEHGATASRHLVLGQANLLAAQGFAVVGVDLPFHGDRGPTVRDVQNNITKEACSTSPCDYLGDLNGLTGAILFFGAGAGSGIEAFDPRVPRDNMQQAASDIMQLGRALLRGDLTPIKVAGAPSDLSFDPAKVTYVGYSFGGIATALAVAVDSLERATVLASVGGGFAYPMIHDSPGYGPQFTPFYLRGFDIAGEVDYGTHPPELHPMFTLYQMVIEPGDALAYAPYLARYPSARGGSPASVLMLQAYRDEAMPNQASEPFFASIGATRVTYSVSTPGFRFATLPSAAAPYAGTNGYTVAALQLYPATHEFIEKTHNDIVYTEMFPPFDPLPTPIHVSNPVREAFHCYTSFLKDAIAGRTPTVVDPFH